VKRHLSDSRIRVLAEDVGGKAGRTLLVDAKTGDVTIRLLGLPDRHLTNLMS
jgi:chemotaxis protein CheD